VSQTPSDTNSSTETYNERWREISAAVRRGHSWSGRERHCVFLNTGHLRFADVSAAVGLDLPDDGRAVALVDWDLDGDLDLWITGRTAPRLRLRRNDLAPPGSAVAFHLEGRTCNRDAIGARLSLVIGSGGDRRVRTLRAGDGYLSQSTRWVHFGLAGVPPGEPLSLEVRWPGGDRETFTAIERGKRYRVVQGSGQVQAASPQPSPSLAASEIEAPARDGTAEVHTSAPLYPMPLFSHQKDGRTLSVADHAGSPLLVNLWWSGCRPCLEELLEFTRRADDLRSAGLQVIALSVDGVGDQPGTAAGARGTLDRMEFPFPSGAATTSLLEKLETLIEYLYLDMRPFPVPTSFLVDERGLLVKIYRGKTTVDRILSDLGRDRSDPARWLDRAVPFSGRWHHRPPSVSPAVIGDQFLKDGHLDDAIRYYRSSLGHPEDADRRAKVHNNLGSILNTRGEKPDAVAAFRRSLAADPEHAPALLNLGSILREQGNPQEGLELLTRCLALRPSNARAHAEIGNCFLALGQIPDAIPPLQEAVKLDPEAHPSTFHNLGVALDSTGRPAEALPHLQKAVDLDPDYARGRAALARVLDAAHRADEAVPHYRWLVARAPKDLDAANRLAWILATSANPAVRNGPEALRLARGVCGATSNGNFHALDTLAAALAETGAFPEAANTARSAAALATSQGHGGLAAQIEARARAYAAGRPHRQ